VCAGSTTGLTSATAGGTWSLLRPKLNIRARI
jgi:hypothetical protein